MDKKADIVIVGGGLAGCLTATKLAAVKPDLHIVIIEESERLGGHHTWRFHSSDLANTGIMTWLRPLITRSWDATAVRFPKFEKTFAGDFHAIRSESLHDHLKRALGDGVVLKKKATRISESHVELSSGEIFAARLVLDARGFEKPATPAIGGYQKFIGLEFEFKEPHGLSAPLIVDATCPQLDGLRYFSLLPWDERRLMIEETYYSDAPQLNRERLHRSLAAYVERQGWQIAKTHREESGVVQIPMTGSAITQPIGGEALPIGMRGGYYHSTTGRSLPEAIRIAEFIASLDDLSTTVARTGLMKFRRSWLSKQRFYRLLNRFVFYAAEPSLRYQVLQHFYMQPPDVIARFHAGRTTWSDRLRLLSGGLPVPASRALKSLRERAIQSWANARPS